MSARISNHFGFEPQSGVIRITVGMSRELDFVTYTKYLVAGYSRGVGLQGYRLGDPLSIAMSNDFFRPLAVVYGVLELQPGKVSLEQLGGYSETATRNGNLGNLFGRLLYGAGCRQTGRRCGVEIVIS